MPNIPGTNYNVFVTTGQTIKFGVTSDPNNPPSPVPGDFNLEVVVNATGTGTYSTAPGYQGLAILSTDTHTLTLLHGDYGVVDNASNDTIILGDGNETIGGAIGDTVIGGTGASQFIDATRGASRSSAAARAMRRSGEEAQALSPSSIRSLVEAVTKRSEPSDLQSSAAAAMSLSMQ